MPVRDTHTDRQTDIETDRQTDSQTNSAENNGPSGLQSGQQTNNGRPKKKENRYTKEPQHVTSHLFAETCTYVVAAPHGFACAVIPQTFQVSPKSVLGFWRHGGGVKIWPSIYNLPKVCHSVRVCLRHAVRLLTVTFGSAPTESCAVAADSRRRNMSPRV